jgi:predicted O-methyltransferase YrrM
MKFLTLFVLLGAFFKVHAVEPYDSINDLPFDSHGWFCNGTKLEKIINEKQPQIVIEVGSWLGLSTRFIAKNVPEGAKVYAVDTWRGSQESVHLLDPRLPYLYQLFLSNVKHAGLTEKIIPIRMDSLEAAKALNVQADLIYIDASHDTASVVADIMHWYPHLKEDGVMCGDDWLWDSVRAAVQSSAPRLGKKIYSEENFWCYVD